MGKRTDYYRNDSASASFNVIDLESSSETSLRTRVSLIFNEIQRNNATHRKSLIALRKIQESCCYEPAGQNQRKEPESFNEVQFNTEIQRCILRILPVKKSEIAGDRAIKFLASFLKQSSGLDNVIFSNDNTTIDGSAPETPSSRLISGVFGLLLQLMPCKDKVVRFRATQVTSHLVNTLDSLDDEQYESIKMALSRRLKDKESNIRVQAVYGLERLIGESSEGRVEDEDDNEINGTLLDKLLEMLQNDPATEVRRSILLNLPFTAETLPFLLERARDVDSTIRRVLYSRLLPALGDFRHLSLTHREKLLRWGLRDRDDYVKTATAKLFRERWIEDCANTANGNIDKDFAKPAEVKSTSPEALLELLERIDVVNAGMDGGIALDAMREFWTGRPDYRKSSDFNELFWKSLTPESAFVARTFNDYSRGEQNNILEDKMPELTKLAFLIQQNTNDLVTLIRHAALQPENEVEIVHQEFIVEQLLNIALTLDYSDEIGRRTMFSLMREAISLAELPEGCTKLSVQVLRLSSGTGMMAEQEFSAVVLEAISEVHDSMGEGPQTSEDADESFHSAQSEMSMESNSTAIGKIPEAENERAVREIMINLQCLYIAQCMLQNVQYGLEKNAHLVAMLNNLIVPAVRSQEAPIRERGLLCLGLCCLLDKNLAGENLTLFIHCFNKGHEELQIIAIQIISDILAAHPAFMFTPALSLNHKADQELTEHGIWQKPIAKVLTKALRSVSSPVQATACIATCKILLAAPIEGDTWIETRQEFDELFKALVVAYFDPDTSDNVALRQTLSYFIPVYCHSKQESMQRMGRIALKVLDWCMHVKEDIDADIEDDNDDQMVSLSLIMAHIADWTDGRKLANTMSMNNHSNNKTEANSEVHVDLAIQLLERIRGNHSKEERKRYVLMLGKLHISAEADYEMLLSAQKHTLNVLESKSIADVSTRTAVARFQTILEKALQTFSINRSESILQSTASLVDEEESGDETMARVGNEQERPPLHG